MRVEFSRDPRVFFLDARVNRDPASVSTKSKQCPKNVSALGNFRDSSPQEEREKNKQTNMEDEIQDGGMD